MSGVTPGIFFAQIGLFAPAYLLFPVPSWVNLWYKRMEQEVNTMRRVLLLVATIILCVGLGSCQRMTEEEIQAAYDEAFAAGAASVDVTSLLEDAEKVGRPRAPTGANRTEGYAEGFDRGYKAGYENGGRTGRAEAEEKRDDNKDSGSSGSYRPYSSSGASGSSNSSSTSSSVSNSGTTVYVTDTGSKYHRYGCQYLRESCHGMTLSKAKQAGYTACSRCDPPA